MAISDYHETILAARQIPLKQTKAVRQRLITAYRSAWLEIDTMLRESQRRDGTFSRQIWRRKQADLERLMMELGVDLKKELNNATRETAEQTAFIREDATNALLKERGLNMVVDFGRIPQETLETLATIQDVEGFKFSASVWGETQSDLINQHVLRASATTKSVSDLAKDLRPFILGADELTPDELKDLRTIRGRERRKLGHSIKAKTERLMRTEISNAAWESGRRSAEESPIVKGVKWNLSLRHPKWDGCDILSSQDLYGLGRGVYPPGTIPPRPHPNCFCYQQDVLRKPEDWDRPKETPELQTSPSAVNVSQPQSTTDRFFQKQRTLAAELSQAAIG